MPNITSAKKRVKVIETKTLRNKIVKSTLKTNLKKFDAAIADNAENKQELFNKAISAVDKATIKGVVHKNKANRNKAQLAKKMNAAITE